MLALIGFNANAAMYIVGNDPFGGWNPANAVEMTLLDDGQTYSYEATLPGTYPNECAVWFIFSEGAGDWNAVNAGRYDSGNSADDMTVTANIEFTPVKGNTDKSFKFVGTAGNTYTITFNPTTMKAMVSGIVVPPTSEIWTVVGEPAVLFGDPTWDLNNNDNNMMLGEDGLYTWTKQNVELSAGLSIQFKVVKNHSYGTSYPTNNYVENVSESGTYDVTITFNPTSQELGITTTKVADGPVVNPLTGELYMMGQVNGNGWAGNVGAAMATEDGNIFTLTDAVIADADQGYGYFSFTSKLGTDANDWSFNDYRRGAEADGTIVEDGVAATLAGWGTSDAFKALAGTYDVTVNLSEGTVLLVAKEAPVPTVDPVYIMGNVNEYTWDAIHGVEMTYDETNKVYTAEVNVYNAEGNDKGFFGFTKKLADAESETDVWAQIEPYRFGPMSEGDFVMTEELLGVACELAEEGYPSIGIPAGTWTVTVDLVNNTFTINGTWPSDTVVPEPVADVYIIGDVNNIGWSATEGVQMTYDETNAVYTAEITTQTQGDLGVAYFGFTKKLADAELETDVWQQIAPYRFGPVSEDAFVMTEELLGVNCALATDGSYNSIAIPAGTWTVTVDMVNNTFAIAGEWPEEPTPEPYTGDLYILGEVNGNSWAPNVGVQMTYDAENAVFTAEVTAEAENYDDELAANYSYFSFTKLLAETADDWAAIAGSRMGAVAEGNFLVTDEYLGHELSLTNGEVAFKVPSGNLYDITVSVDEMYVIINKVEPTQWELGDVNHDHSIDVGDVTALIAHILGNTPEQFYTSEANVDGDADNAYDVGDVTALIAKILGS